MVAAVAADERGNATDDEKKRPDDREPSAERQAELRAAYEANITASNAPYGGVAIGTRGELYWVLRERDWSGQFVTDKARPNLSGAYLGAADLTGAKLREADLSGAHLHEANLSRADLFIANLSRAYLREADLTGANLVGTNLSGANLETAELSGATLYDANLSGTYLSDSNLSGANLKTANLSSTDLRLADLSGADLRGANLSGTYLGEARMDNATVLTDVKFDTHTKLGDVVWNDVSLTRVDWSQAPRLGDEDGIAYAMNRKERLRRIRDAARAYRGLGVALRGQGLVDYASGYRLREQRLERRALRLERRYGGWFFSLLLDAVAGYGERPGRIFGAYVLVIASFAVAYGLVTHFVETQLHQLSWDEALVLSLTSFHGRGFFPGSLPLGDWVARIAAGEAVIGLFIELILIATFSKRFLGN